MQISEKLRERIARQEREWQEDVTSGRVFPMRIKKCEGVENIYTAQTLEEYKQQRTKFTGKAEE